MKRAVDIALGVQIVLGLCWTLAAATAQGAGGLAAFFVFLVVYAVFACAAVFALWVLWRHPALRPRAGWILGLPVIFWFLPGILRSVAGGVVTSHQLLALLLWAAVFAIGFAWIFPSRAAVVMPRFLVASRVFNWLVLLAVPAGWAFLIGVVVLLSTGGGSSSSGTAVAYAIILAALYLVGLGLGSFGVSTWAWLSLRGGFESAPRKLNIAQLIVALPGVVAGLLVAAWLVQQGRL